MNRKQRSNKEIMLLILFTAIVCLGVLNAEALLAVIKSFIVMLKPFIVGAAIAFVLNLPMKYIEENYSDVSPDVIHTAYTEACSNDEIPIDDYIKKLHIFFGGHRPDRLHFLQVACDLAVCDNELNKEEYGVLLDLEHAFNLPGETDHYFKRNYGDEMKWKRYILTGISQEELDRSYALFECGNKIPLRTLKAIYRRKCFEYHPDRLKQSNSDITPEEAEKAIRDLNEAYRTIMLGTGNKERVS